MENASSLTSRSTLSGPTLTSPKTILLVVVLAVILGLSAVSWLLAPSLKQGAGPFERAHWDAVIEQVRASGVAPGETRQFRLDDLGDPKTLRPRQPSDPSARGHGAGDVWGIRTAAGKLRVVIETRDLGHGGEFGFAYSEEPLTPTPFGSDWFRLDVPGHLNLVQPKMQIDDSWWRVLNNLD